MEYKGNPITPLPDNWSWYEAKPDLSIAIDPRLGSWNKAVDERLDLTKITVVEKEPNGYVWENPPIELLVPMYSMRFGYSVLSYTTNELYGKYQPVEGEETLCTMVPYGCTNLRITYIPRAKLTDENK